MTYTALGGFAILLVVHRVDPAEVWARIDWSVLIFFGGLFVVGRRLRAKRRCQRTLFAHLPLFGARPRRSARMLRTAAYFLSGATSSPTSRSSFCVQDEMAKLPDVRLGWELLAMASTFAGNLTLLGSVANIIVSEKSQEVGGLKFVEYAKAGVPIAFATTAIGTLWLTLTR